MQCDGRSSVDRSKVRRVPDSTAESAKLLCRLCHQMARPVGAGLFCDFRLTRAPYTSVYQAKMPTSGFIFANLPGLKPPGTLCLQHQNMHHAHVFDQPRQRIVSLKLSLTVRSAVQAKMQKSPDEQCAGSRKRIRSAKLLVDPCPPSGCDRTRPKGG